MAPGNTSDSAWIDGSTNCVGVQGALYFVKDNAQSSIYFTSRTNHACVAGTIPHPAAIDSTHWGVQLVIELANTGTSAGIYNASTHSVTGFSFTLNGTLPSTTLAQYRVDGSATEYCEVLNSGAAHYDMPISAGHPNCWSGTPGTATPDPSKLTRFEFVVPANTASDVTFDFCVEGLTAIK